MNKRSSKENVLMTNRDDHSVDEATDEILTGENDHVGEKISHEQEVEQGE